MSRVTLNFDLASLYQKGKTKTNLDFQEQEIVSGSGPYANLHLDSYTTVPASHHSVFYRLDALSAAPLAASKH